MERFPVCPRCGETMQEGVKSGDTLMRVWECRRCGETQAREYILPWSDNDCLLAIAAEQKNIRGQLSRIADALEAMLHML